MASWRENKTRTAKEKQRQANAYTTFLASSEDSSTVTSEDSASPAEEVDDDEEKEDNDGPVVFICGKCKLPVGDSVSWDGSEDGLNQIRLKRVTENVLVGEKTRCYEAGKKSFCLVVDLLCRGCCTVLGMVYSSTPKSLDHKRFSFCLDVANIESYVLGSAAQMLPAGGPKEQPVTLEYTNTVEDQLTEMKTLVVTMAQKLSEIESSLRE
ncbi:protein Mis18-alpha [Genypterus blacodes]|uniref:protein Mis18-alpha n=1 Tax=Genypterus blacodes TaxID=154954 RepID=UPI003F771197